MIPTPEDPTVYLGDVYILQDSIIMGMVGGIQFRRYPRVLLNRFFSAPDDKSNSHTSAPAVPSTKPVQANPQPMPKTVVVPKAPPKEIPDVSSTSASAVIPVAAPTAAEAPAPKPVETAVAISSDSDSLAARAMALIAKEAGLDLADLQDEASFASLGIDSLMSLVLAEKFREELGVTVGGSLFLEYPTLGDLRGWLEEYYS